MAVDKNKAIIQYLSDCPQIKNSPLYFNFIQAKDNNKQIVTIENDKAAQKPFIDGSVLKVYTFTIIDYKSIAYQAIVKASGEGLTTSDPVEYANENVEEMFDVQKILDWVEEQDDAQNFPDFGSDCEVEKIEALTENPRLNGVDVSVAPVLAKYSISIRVTYLDTSKQLWN